MSDRFKIMFILPSLKPGGAERVVSYISQNIDNKRFDCELVVIGFAKDQFYSVKSLPVVFLNKKRAMTAFTTIYKNILMKRPDVVFSSIAHLNIMMGILSIFFPKTKFVGREATVGSAFKMHSQNHNKRILLSRTISKIGYRNLNKVICQSKDMATDFLNNYGIAARKLVTINNPISSSFKPKKEKPSNIYPVFITVGSLTKVKGHDRVLRALKKLKTPFTYIIIGNGNEADEIMEQAKTLGIKNKIDHIPFTNEVEKYLERSDVFLQGSYVEGFPNALLESCAVGTPVLAFQAPGGTNEIIEEGINGFIAMDEEDFVRKLQQILAMDWDSHKISESVYQKFNSSKILSQYEDLFIDLVQPSLSQKR